MLIDAAALPDQGRASPAVKMLRRYAQHVQPICWPRVPYPPEAPARRITHAATSATTQAGYSAEKREYQPLVIGYQRTSLHIAEATAPRKRQGWPTVRETDKVADRQGNHAVQAPCLSQRIRIKVRTTERIPERRCARIHSRMSILAAQSSEETVRPRSNAEAARLTSRTT